MGSEMCIRDSFKTVQYIWQKRRSETTNKGGSVGRHNDGFLTFVVFHGCDCQYPTGGKRQKTIVMTPDGAAFIGRLRAALLPDVLNCFENWPADKIERFSSDLVAFRTWLQDNRV